MGKVMFMRKGDLHTAPSAGIPAGELAVGSSIWLNENGTLAEYLVVNQGIPSESTLYDSSCDGVWLLRKDCYESRQWHSSNSNSYSASTIHSYLNSSFLNLFDTNTQNAIKQVKIPYVNGTAGSAIASGANGLEVKVFLLCGYEVGFTQSDNQYFPIDGACLDYFIGVAQTVRIAKINGSATLWWLRSLYNYRNTSTWCVSAQGLYGGQTCSNSYGIRPALVLPSDCKLTDNGEGKLILVGGAS